VLLSKGNHRTRVLQPQRDIDREKGRERERKRERQREGQRTGFFCSIEALYCKTIQSRQARQVESRRYISSTKNLFASYPSYCFPHTEPLTHRRFCTEAVTHRRIYTHTLLHTEAFTHRRFYTQKLLHTEAFTRRH
jgi:hypothetical protein